MRVKPSIVALGVLLSVGIAAGAQQELFTVKGSARGVGDLDGDGRGDYASWQGGSDTVRVLSGATQQLLLTLTGDAIGIGFGQWIDGVGDLDGDGVGDIGIGAPDADGQGVDSGFVRVVSGADGATLFTTHGSEPGAHLGLRVAGIGDASGDGIPDLAATAAAFSAADQHARVLLLSGADGSVLAQCGDTVSQGLFGWLICGPGDMNADGRADVAVCGHSDDDAWVFSGADGTLLRTFAATGGITHITPAGDHDGDGVPDVAALDKGIGQGVGRVYSGARSAVLLSVQPPPGFAARALVGLGLVDGDGVPDYALASAPETPDWDGQIALVSGATGATLYTTEKVQVVGPELFDPSFGNWTLPVSDIDGDGVPELSSSSVTFETVVLSGRPSPFDQLTLGVASPMPGLLAGVGTLEPGSPLSLWMTKLPAGSAAFLVVGASRLSVPFKGSELVPTPTLVLGPVATNAAGALTLEGGWPATFPAGVPLWFQAWAVEPVAPLGWRSTNAIAATSH